MGTVRALGALTFGLLAASPSAVAQAQAAPSTRCEGTPSAGATAPTPADPYPLLAAGWGPEAGRGLMICRWAEDWTGMRAQGTAPRFKAIPVGDEASLTLSAEARIRFDAYDNAQLSRGQDKDQGLFRGVLGADLRFNPQIRAYAEVATGQVLGHRSSAAANFQNEASLQQVFLEGRGHLGSTLLGLMVGRQEFTDGPRQLMSLSDGPNLHRTWNGVRLFAHGAHGRVGAFDLRVTRLKDGAFDDGLDTGERLQGVNGSLNLTPAQGPNVYLDPFWFHTEQPTFRSGGRSGLDDRDTFGLRLWGRRGGLRFDWTFARQSGRSLGRDVQAWAVFGVQSYALTDQGLKPTLTLHLDLASGGGSYGTGTVKAFNPLYASSSYLGEGQFLALSNLSLIAPGFSLAPTAASTLTLEVGLARRLEETEAVYAGGMKAYSGTQALGGRAIGTLLRVTATWAVTTDLTLFADLEHLRAGAVLQQARRPSGSYGYVGLTYRY